MKIRANRPTDALRACAAALALLLGAAACDLDVANPNALPRDEALATADGLLAVVVGMQDVFAENIEEYVQAPALVTDEWGTGTRSLPSYRALLTGEGLTADLGVVEEPWETSYDVINLADQVLDNVSQVGLAPGQATGVGAIARLFKGMAYGMLTLQYERLVLNPDAAEPELSPRDVALDTVLALLESARTDAATLSPDDLAFLESRVLGDGFDLVQTIDAMLARYYLVDGRYDRAIEAAERVDLEATSVFPYTAPDANPICELSECDLAYVFPLVSWVADAEAGDERPAFWVDVAAEPFTGNPPLLLLPLNAYGSLTSPFLVYVPDEMTLIRAEAYTRLGDLERARELVNEVRTRPTIEPVAGLPPLPPEALDTVAELLNQIAYERRYELYEQGLRWEDTRRLDEFVEVEPTIRWLPVPLQECRTNPGLGC